MRRAKSSRKRPRASLTDTTPTFETGSISEVSPLSIPPPGKTESPWSPFLNQQDAVPSLNDHCCRFLFGIRPPRHEKLVGPVKAPTAKLQTPPRSESLAQ